MTVPDLTGREIGQLLAPQGAPRQPMTGYDADYADIVDYIIRCTHRIWEQKDVGLIETHYAPDIRMHLMTGPIEGSAGVIGNTMKTLAAFPDRTLVGEAVIWSEEVDGAYLSSHRITSSGTNLGSSEFGAATGRQVQFTTVADCLCRANRIVEEWLVRDNSALVIALGLSPRRVAREQAQADIASASSSTSWPTSWRRDKIAALRGSKATPFPPTALPEPCQAKAFAHALFDAVWNHRRLALIRNAYSPAVRSQQPGGRLLFGHGEVIGWATALLASFTDARFRIDHVASIDGEAGTDIAVRWEMAGRHDGPMLYGPPTGEDAYILGITHWRIADSQIVDEVTVFDEIALLRQLEGGL